MAGNAATRVTAYLKFTLPSLAAGESITDASLSVFVSGTTANGPKVFPTTTTVDRDGADLELAADADRLDGGGRLRCDEHAERAVEHRRSPAVPAGGDVSFELFADATDGLDFAVTGGRRRGQPPAARADDPVRMTA